MARPSTVDVDVTALLEAIAQPLFLLSTDGRVLHANGIAKRLFPEPPAWHRSSAPVPTWARRMPLPGQAGGLVLEVIDPICDSIQLAPSAPWAVRASLPPRLARMAACILQGMSDKMAADTLGISYDTARTYARLLLQQMGVGSRVELCALIRRWMSGGEEGLENTNEF